MALFNYIIVILLLTLSALFSGLTLGLMSLGPYSLQRKIKLGNPDAKKIYPLRKKGNQLLSTLLIGNIAVNSAIAVFLGSLTAGVVAGFVSTALIVIFGEIVPQAVFSRHALRFGARFTWLVYIFFYLFFPFTWPIAYALDKLLGKELPSVFTKREFFLFLEQQKELKDAKSSDIKEHEFSILQKGLTFSDKTVRDAMTPWKQTYYLTRSTRLSKVSRLDLHRQGCSRIPVYDTKEKKVIGILYVKDLVSMPHLNDVPVEKMMRSMVHYIFETDKLDKVLNLFKKNRVHLFIVVNAVHKVVGIITLEDVLEEIVGEIFDEHEDEADLLN
ncbi:HlyC/CorC family transporter [Candidatus Woesearchaeota archaeon]|nr:HlyC/CorC family transporter [Candidatus Woesearchaeota archaeon]